MKHLLLALLCACAVPSSSWARVSNRLESGVNGPVSAGANVDVFCRVVSPTAGSVTSCQWTSPDGSVYDVVDGIVTDEQGNVQQNLLAAGAIFCF